MSRGFSQTVPSCSSHCRVHSARSSLPLFFLSSSLTAQCKRPWRPHHRKRSGKHQTLNLERARCPAPELNSSRWLLSLCPSRKNVSSTPASSPLQPLSLPEKLSSTQINIGGQGLVKKGAGPMSGNSNYITIWLVFSVMCGQSYAMQSEVCVFAFKTFSFIFCKYTVTCKLKTTS